VFTIGIIGAGITGTALAVRLAQHDYHIGAVSSRSMSSAQRLSSKIAQCRIYETNQGVADNAQYIFITTPDDAIATVTNSIKWHENQYVLHCSGAHSLDILEPAKQCGAATGCFHPLQSFADIDQAIDNLPGTTFAIEAAEPLLTTLKNMADRLEGDWVQLKAGDKVLYHAAAVFASNYLVTLVKLSTDLWQSFGVPQEKAVKALMPLLRGTLNNIHNIGLPQCLTGPIARGDSGTITKHLNALNNGKSELLESYRLLGKQTIPIAVAKGKVTDEKAEELKALLN
jgi:predicted short-subunit dehydrogenase-like oxidoreductase (DUF2520 family)